MPLSDNPLDILKKYWSYDAFREPQEAIIEAILAHQDTLALMPTGGGKSLCYQIPGIIKDGICLVISPLIALMKDQVAQLNERNIKAIAIYSGMSMRETDIALDNAIYGGYKFLYVSPERLQTPLFQARVQQMQINLIAVDEAHCISSWGYDFRPSYLKIAELRELLPSVPILALTASATTNVREDIKNNLNFKVNHCQFVKSFDRPNLIYAVLEEEDKKGRLLTLFQKVQGSALVYVRTRKAAKEIATHLMKHHLSASYYHAGLTKEEREHRQNIWKDGKLRIMVCTNAFGMGIDKADVRMVVHYHIPDSLEAYYQEAGRAGRDGKKSFAIVLEGPTDANELNRLATLKNTTANELKRLYHALGNYFNVPLGAGLGVSYNFDIAAFASRFDLDVLKVFPQIKILESLGYIALNEAVYLPSTLHFTVNHQELYKYQVAKKEYELIIKYILRTYAGSLEGYVSINEQHISKAVKLSSREVIKLLHQLKAQNILDYIPQKTEPQLTYLTERIPEDHLALDYSFLKQRMQVNQDKLQAILRYMQAENSCRGKMILNYFGENVEKDCGHCDYCLKNQRGKNGKIDLRKQIINILENQTLSLSELILSIEGLQEREALQMIRTLLDEKIIARENDKLVLL